MCVNTFSEDSNPPLNAVQLMVYEVLMFHENIKLLPSGDSYDLSLGNIDPAERITPVLVSVTVINQLGWVELARYD